MNGPRPRRVVVLGGGITGLCAAYEALRAAERARRPVEVLVLESTGRVGGKVVSESREGALIEGGPDSFLTSKTDVLELADELGLAGEVAGTDPKSRGASIYSGGRLHPLPPGAGFWPDRAWPWLGSGLLSWRAKARLALSPFVPPIEGEQDESLADFARRRLGAELLEKVVGPIFAGIYAGDAEALSVQSAFPQLKALESRGSPKTGAAEGRTLFATLRGGLSRLTETLALRLPRGTVRTGSAVSAIKRRGGLWQVHAGAEVHEADAVVSALPAHALAAAAADLDLELACILREIPFVSTATVSFLYDGAAFPRRLEGYGFLTARGEGKALAGATYTSSKFPFRAPPGSVLIRCFLGGAGREEIVHEDDPVVARTARAELKEILGLGDAHPRLSRVHRWIKANPQYTVGHALRLRRLDSCLKGHPGLLVAGCSYHGVGLPDCVRSGREAGRRAVASLSGAKERDHVESA